MHLVMRLIKWSRGQAPLKAGFSVFDALWSLRASCRTRQEPLLIEAFLWHVLRRYCGFLGYGLYIMAELYLFSISWFYVKSCFVYSYNLRLLCSISLMFWDFRYRDQFNVLKQLTDVFNANLVSGRAFDFELALYRDCLIVNRLDFHHNSSLGPQFL